MLAILDCHVGAAVRCVAHCLMEHIPGYNRSHWMPPSGKCLHPNCRGGRSEGFWLAKHKHTNIPTMMEPFPPPVAWF